MKAARTAVNYVNAGWQALLLQPVGYMYTYALITH
jgi:hypothetical protein